MPLLAGEGMPPLKRPAAPKAAGGTGAADAKKAKKGPTTDKEAGNVLSAVLGWYTTTTEPSSDAAAVTKGDLTVRDAM